MISEFLESWPLFQESYLVAILCGMLLSLLGVMVVGRNEVFVAAAVAQASVLGVALALTLQWGNPVVLAVSFSVAASLATAGRARRGEGRREEMTAWVFLAASSLAVLVLTRSPIGMNSVQSVLSSSLLGASRTEVWIFALMNVIAGVAALLWRRHLVLLLLDPVMAAAVGMAVGLWSAAIAATIGLVSGLAIHCTGLLFTFGCMVLPALIARNLSRTVGPMFFLAPAIGLVSVLSGLVLAHAYDFPPGQLIVVILAVLLATAWSIRELRLRMARSASVLGL